MLKPRCSGGWCPTKVRKLLVPILRTTTKVSPCVSLRVEWSVFSRETLRNTLVKRKRRSWSLATVDRLSIDETSELGWKSWTISSDILRFASLVVVGQKQIPQITKKWRKMVMNLPWDRIHRKSFLKTNPWQQFCDFSWPFWERWVHCHLFLRLVSNVTSKVGPRKRGHGWSWRLNHLEPPGFD